MPEKLNFDALWRDLAGHVRAAIRRHPAPDVAMAAEDIEQEVRIRVWQTLEGDKKGRFPAYYYYKVVNSAIVDSLRRYRGTMPRHRREGDDTALENPDMGNEPGPREAFGDIERKRQLEAAIDRLPRDRAKAVRLFLQGFSVPEIAELMACDENRAHNLAYRGKRALMDLMALDRTDYEQADSND